MDRQLAKSAAARIVLFLAATSAAQSQQVWVVGAPGPGVLSQEIQPAIDAAAEGDVILVKSGGGQGLPWLIQGKSLTLIRDSNASTVVAPGAVAGLQVTQSALVRGFQILKHLDIANNAGPVWIEDCQVFTTALISQGANALISINNCASVTLQRCTVTAYEVDPPSPPALFSSGSLVYVSASIIKGGKGPDGFNCFRCHGADAVRIQSGTLFATGCTFQGGNAGLAGGDPQVLGHNGGDGLDNAGDATLIDTLLFGGSASVGPAGPGIPGAPFVGVAPTILPGVARSFAMSSPVRESNAIVLSLGGVPNETAAIYYSPSQMIGLPFPAFDAVFAVSFVGANSFPLGVISSGGTLSATFQAPVLPAPILGATVYAQSFFFDSPLTYLVVGPASSLVVLDSSL